MLHILGFPVNRHGISGEFLHHAKFSAALQPTVGISSLVVLISAICTAMAPNRDVLEIFFFKLKT